MHRPVVTGRRAAFRRARLSGAALATVLLALAPPACTRTGSLSDPDTDRAADTLVTACTPEGLGYTAHALGARCCEGLVHVPERDVPRDDYPGDDYPPGCGPSGVPPDDQLCIACGDGACGTGETFCNCAADCPRDTDGGAR